MSLNQIIENYGEPWQISQIKNYAGSHYDTIVTLRNEDATENNLKSYLEKFAASNLTIDIVFCLHGSENVISFYNHETCNIVDFSNYVCYIRLAVMQGRLYRLGKCQVFMQLTALPDQIISPFFPRGILWMHGLMDPHLKML
jgi:hypothetical protein